MGPIEVLIFVAFFHGRDCMLLKVFSRRFATDWPFYFYRKNAWGPQLCQMKCVARCCGLVEWIRSYGPACPVGNIWAIYLTLSECGQSFSRADYLSAPGDTHQ